jgi:hypothetical protein
VQIHDDLVEEDDALAPKGELKTLENHPLENFVFNLLPSINLTPGKANDVDTTSFEKRQEEIARLMENARYGSTGCGVFQTGGIKLERFLPFENWIDGEPQVRNIW